MNVITIDKNSFDGICEKLIINSIEHMNNNKESINDRLKRLSKFGQLADTFHKWKMNNETL